MKWSDLDQDYVWPCGTIALVALMLLVTVWHGCNNDVKTHCLDAHYPAHLCKQLP